MATKATTKKKSTKSGTKASSTKVVPGSKRLSNQRHEMFCMLWATSKEYFGNSTRSYMAAFGYEDKISKAEEELVEIRYSKEVERKKKRREITSMKNTCRNNGARLLANASITNRCNYLLQELYSHVNADRELAFVMTQRKDLASKVSAIKEYNRVQDRVNDNKVEHSGEVVVRWLREDEEVED